MLGRRWDPRLLLAVGLAVTAFAFFEYAHLNMQAGPYDILWPQMLQGAAMALVFVPLTTVTMDPIPLPSMGYATAIYSLVRNIGSSMGISFVTTELARRSQFHQARLVESVTPFNPMLQHGVPGLPGGTGGSQQALGMLYGQVQQQAALLSFLELFRILGILFLLVIPVLVLMRRPEHHRGPGAAAH
jgi:DHA2 family multidrug resistance protein